MITNRNEAKAEHISCDWKNGKRKQVTMYVKIIVSAKKIIFGILAQVFVKIVSI